MTLPDWLAHAQADAVRRGLPTLAPILESLARATTALRAADWNETAAADHRPPRDRQGDLRG